MADAIARGHNVLKKVAARKYLIVAVGAVVVFSAPWLFGWPQVLLGVAATDIVLFARQHFCPLYLSFASRRETGEVKDASLPESPQGQ
jgi:hypothetical protein